MRTIYYNEQIHIELKGDVYSAIDSMGKTVRTCEDYDFLCQTMMDLGHYPEGKERKNILTVQSWRKDEIRFEIWGNGSYIRPEEVTDFIRNNAERLSAEIIRNHHQQQQQGN